MIKTRMIALNGILGALAVVSLLLAVVLPTGRLAFYALSSFFISVSIIEYGVRGGWFFYLATGILSLIIVPDKLGIIPYIVFFGMYGIIKYYIEKTNNLAVEYIIKIVYFNLCLTAAYYFMLQFFFTDVTVKLPWWFIIILLEIIFIVYDYVYTLFIIYYRNKLKKMLRI